jgi:hypothetical protein
VSFTIDGTERVMEITNTTGGSDLQYLQYNQTLFQVDNLPNVSHTLSIQTLDDSLFIVSTYLQRIILCLHLVSLIT